MAGWWLVTAVFLLFLILAVTGIIVALKSGIHPEDAERIDAVPKENENDSGTALH
ncbi:hypothetical protein [Metabacillus sp. RGM 3146]|uniref:hypothetical protein n=1 Tax=Metabacillus sp. RGM 3146 TaxID=3401092 RepID=UPI003B9A76BA